ncbi:hypothetical protein EYF80_048781 [Liparis tanakae]|uniref:Uncharacterized protein n=1 Tax=Liparis tanakae TaxID=230148 RepID=A0A4Z2FJT8_9TELE|nr:hypothetical protein EYF80_048781 [Liparis tanakae]
MDEPAAAGTFDKPPSAVTTEDRAAKKNKKKKKKKVNPRISCPPSSPGRVGGGRVGEGRRVGVVAEGPSETTEVRGQRMRQVESPSSRLQKHSSACLARCPGTRPGVSICRLAPNKMTWFLRSAVSRVSHARRSAAPPLILQRGQKAKASITVDAVMASPGGGGSPCRTDILCSAP